GLRPPRTAAPPAATSSSSMACRPYGSSASRTGRPPWMASRSATGHLAHLGAAQPPRVGVARVAVSVGRALALPGRERPGGIDRLDHEHVVELDRLAALVLGDQDLVALLPPPDYSQLHH